MSKIQKENLKRLTASSKDNETIIDRDLGCIFPDEIYKQFNQLKVSSLNKLLYAIKNDCESRAKLFRSI